MAFANRYNGSHWTPHGSPIALVNTEPFDLNLDMSADREHITTAFWNSFDNTQPVKNGKALVFQHINGNWKTIRNKKSGANETISGFRYTET